jgi:hypothetical protein
VARPSDPSDPSDRTDLSDLAGPPEVRALLAAYAGALRRCLGDDLTGVYVYGSLALGAHVPAGSDVDVAVLLRDDPGAGQRRALAALHRGPAGPLAALPLADRLDVSFVPRRLAGGYGDAALPYAREGEFHDAGGGDVNPVLWHTLHTRGITVWGPPAAAVVPAVSAAALVACMRRNLDFLERRMPHYVAAGTATQVFGVLSLCRVLHTLRTGAIAGKVEAARWAEGQVGAPWRAVVARAATRYAGTDYATPDPLLAGAAVPFTGHVRALAPSPAAEPAGRPEAAGEGPGPAGDA